MNNLKKSDVWKIQLTIAINFIYFKINDECVMHWKFDNIKIMTYNKADEVITEPFESLFSRYQSGLKTLMKGSDFIYDCVHLLYHIVSQNKS